MFVNEFPGLSAAEFADIHSAVLEAMGFVLRPVVFHEPTQEGVDDLYGESQPGEESHATLPEIGASTRYKPAKETLTRMGLKVEAEVVLFIPRGEILRWESAHDKTFAPTEYGWEVTAQGRRFNVYETQKDPLPVGIGEEEDYIGLVVTGYKEK